MADAEDSTSSSKTCKRCGEIRAAEAFSRVSRRIGGRDHTCKACRNAARSPEARARRNAATKFWKKREREKHLDLKRAQSERYRRARGMKPMSEVRAQVATDREVKREAARDAKRARASQVEAARAQKPWLKPGLTDAERWRIRYKCDPQFNLRERIRTALRHKREGVRLGETMRLALNQARESRSLEDKLGYTISDLRRHMEKQFHAGMDWAAFVEGRIHIDHILPLSGFDLSTQSELKAAWALTNLRPMWAADNIKKGAGRALLL